MLTAACAAVSLAILAAVAGLGYMIGRHGRPPSEGYLAGRASGWRDRGRHEENARAALRRQLEEVTADRDRLDAALDEMGRQHDLLVRQVAEIHGTALVGDDTFAVFGGDR